MADILISIGQKVVECLMGPILDCARYLFGFKKLIKDLEGATNGLKTRLDEVNERKEQAAQNSKEIMLTVKNWLNDVEKILEEAQGLQQMVEREGKSCLNVACRYSLAKQMDTKANRMMQLKDSHFEEENFSCLTQIPGITYFSSEDFVDFNSRQSTFNNLLKAITDGKNKIGLYGMGGSGKTTLAKEVGKKVHDLKVVFVVVSKPPNVVMLQQEIAEHINLTFQPNETQFARAQRLSERLKTMKILIILDDVWEYLRLEDIGIPLVEGCLILLTTRLQNVCVSMGCEPIIELPLINKEEAWKLFKKHANLNNDPLNKFDDVGRKIVDECKELPIAIVVVGISLKGKPIEFWQYALRQLKTFQPVTVEPGFISPYACIKLSYDRLLSPTTKSLFLLCSMFPEDHEIHTEDLVRFGKRTLELDASINAMEDARIQIRVAINILLDSCLLIRTNNQACVKMHDLVRDVALWIAKEQHQAILVDKDKLLSNYQSLKDTKTLSLWNVDKNFKLSNQLHSPTIDVLLLQPHGFVEDFLGIEALKVLALVPYGFGWEIWWKDRIDCLIPQSIVSLTNLHTLCLRGKKLSDISFLGELKGLEVLDLRGSQFNELPLGIVDMKMLKLLDLFCCEIEKSPLDVIQRCEQLEELYLWDKKSIIPENFSLSRLERYIICDSIMGASSHKFSYSEKIQSLGSLNEPMRVLFIQGFRVSTLVSPMKDLVHRANFLWMDNSMWDPVHINLFEIEHLRISNCQEQRFIMTTSAPKMRKLSIIDCDKMKWLFSFDPASHYPSLEIINIDDCDELEMLFNEEPAHEIQCPPDQPLIIFPKLKKIYMWNCNNVKLLLPYSVVLHCHSLEKLEIICCSELERLVGESNDKHKLESLLDKQQHLIIFPKLKEISIKYCDNVRLLLPYSVASHCHSLEKLEIHYCPELERLVGGSNDEEVAYDGHKLESLPHKQQPLIILSKLKVISMEDCNKMRLLLPYSVTSHCHSLEKLSISSCSKLERLVGGSNDEEVAYGNYQLLCKLKILHLRSLPKWREVFEYDKHKLEPLLPKQEHENERVAGVLISELEYIYLDDLPELDYIFKGPTQIVSLHKLEKVYLENCQRLRNIFNLATVTSFPKLKLLNVRKCKEWEGILCEESLKSIHASSSSSICCFPKLEKVCISECHEVRRLFSYPLAASHCPSLKEIYIEECRQFEGVVQAYEGEVATHHNGNNGKLFPSLNYLELIRLPKLREIYTGYEFNNPSHYIRDCPNICNIPLEDKASSSSSVAGTYHIQERPEAGGLENQAASNASLDFAESNKESVKETEAKDLTPTLLEKQPQLTSTSLQNFEETEKEDGRPASKLPAPPLSSSQILKTSKEVAGTISSSSSVTATASYSNSKITKNIKDPMEQGLEQKGVAGIASKSSVTPTTSKVSSMKETHEEEGFKEDEATEEPTIRVQLFDSESRKQLKVSPTIAQSNKDTKERDLQVNYVEDDDVESFGSINSYSRNQSTEPIHNLISRKDHAPSIKETSDHSNVQEVEPEKPIPQVIPPLHYQSQTAEVGTSSPKLGICEIFELVELKHGETSLLAQALEQYPQLLLPREHRTNRIIALSYRVLVDILVMLATKTPNAITQSEKSTLKDNLSEAIVLGFDKDWVESVRAKVFEVDMSDVSKAK